MWRLCGDEPDSSCRRLLTPCTCSSFLPPLPQRVDIPCPYSQTLFLRGRIIEALDLDCCPCYKAPNPFLCEPTGGWTYVGPSSKRAPTPGFMLCAAAKVTARALKNKTKKTAPLDDLNSFSAVTQNGFKITISLLRYRPDNTWRCFPAVILSFPWLASQEFRQKNNSNNNKTKLK